MAMDLLQQYWSEASVLLLRVGGAVAAGAVVGVEREFRDKPAGLRTMILISLGSCVFAMVSAAVTGPMVDTTRIAAQVVTGVGFLGAGSILRSAKAVYGLTTAASIWMVAAIGMACGFGLFGIAGVGTVAILLVLTVVHRVGFWIDQSRTTRKYRIATRDPKVTFRDLLGLFTEARLRVLASNCYRDGSHFVFTFRVRGPSGEHSSLRERLLHHEQLILRR